MSKLSHGAGLSNRLAILSLCLAGCSIVNTFVVETENKPYIDSQFRHHVDMFKIEAAWRGLTVDIDKVSVMFDVKDKDPSVVGLCSLSFIAPTIRIRHDIWNTMQEEEREALLFHELGHCLLHRNHCDNDSGTPISLMNSTVFGGDLYSKNRSRFIDELFSPDTRCVRSSKDIDSIDR